MIREVANLDTLLAGRTLDLLLGWLDAARKVASDIVIASAAALGQYEIAYTAAHNSLKLSPNDLTAQQTYADTLDAWDKKLEASFVKRLDRASEYLDSEKYKSADETIKSVHNSFLDPIRENFTQADELLGGGLLGFFNKHEGRLRLLTENIEQTKLAYETVEPQLALAKEQFITQGNFAEALRVIDQIDFQANMPPLLGAKVESLRGEIEDAAQDQEFKSVRSKLVDLELQFPNLSSLVEFELLQKQVEELYGLFRNEGLDKKYLEDWHELEKLKADVEKKTSLYKAYQGHIDAAVAAEGAKNWPVAATEYHLAAEIAEQLANRKFQRETKAKLNQIEPYVKAVEEIDVQFEALSELISEKLLDADDYKIGSIQVAITRINNMVRKLDAELRSAYEEQVNPYISFANLVENYRGALIRIRDERFTIAKTLLRNIETRLNDIVDKGLRDRLENAVISTIAEVDQELGAIEAVQSIRQDLVKNDFAAVRTALNKIPANSTVRAGFEAELEFREQAKVLLAQRDLPADSDHRLTDQEIFNQMDRLLAENAAHSQLFEYSKLESLKTQINQKLEFATSLVRIEQAYLSRNFKLARELLAQARADKQAEELLSAAERDIAQAEDNAFRAVQKKFRERDYRPAYDDAHGLILNTSTDSKLKRDLDELLGLIVPAWVKTEAQRLSRQVAQAPKETVNSVCADVVSQIDAMREELTPKPSAESLQPLEETWKTATEKLYQNRLAEMTTKLAATDNADELLALQDNLSKVLEEPNFRKLPLLIHTGSSLRRDIDRKIDDLNTSNLLAKVATRYAEAQDAKAKDTIDGLRTAQTDLQEIAAWLDDDDPDQQLSSIQSELSAIELSIQKYEITEKAIQNSKVARLGGNYEGAESELGNVSAVSELLKDAFRHEKAVVNELLQVEKLTRQNEPDWGAVLKHSQAAIALDPELEDALTRDLSYAKTNLYETLVSKQIQAFESDTNLHLVRVLQEDWRSAQENQYISKQAEVDVARHIENLSVWEQALNYFEQLRVLPTGEVVAQLVEDLNQLETLQLPERSREILQEWRKFSAVLMASQQLQHMNAKEMLGTDTDWTYVEADVVNRLRAQILIEAEKYSQFSELKTRVQAMTSAETFEATALIDTLNAQSVEIRDLPEYDMLLAEIATQLTNSIERKIANDDYLGATEASAELLRLTPNAPAAQQLAKDIIAQQQARVETLLKGSLAAIERRELDVADSELKIAEKIDNNESIKNARQKLGLAQTTEAEILKIQQEVDDHLDRGEWTAVIRKLDRAQDLDLEHPQTRAVTAKVEQKLLQQSETHRKADHYAKAIDLLNSTRTLKLGREIGSQLDKLEREQDAEFRHTTSAAEVALDNWQLKKGAEYLATARRVKSQDARVKRLFDLLQERETNAPILAPKLQVGWDAFETQKFDLAKTSFVEAVDADQSCIEPMIWRDLSTVFLRLDRYDGDQEDVSGLAQQLRELLPRLHMEPDVAPTALGSDVFQKHQRVAYNIVQMVPLVAELEEVHTQLADLEKDKSREATLARFDFLKQIKALRSELQTQLTVFPQPPADYRWGNPVYRTVKKVTQDAPETLNLRPETDEERPEPIVKNIQTTSFTDSVLPEDIDMVVEKTQPMEPVTNLELKEDSMNIGAEESKLDTIQSEKPKIENPIEKTISDDETTDPNSSSDFSFGNLFGNRSVTGIDD